ncbi:MAG TPA: hypothetical protein VFB13_13030 [Reyranella sp.]|nr:hypothetical protein [Reyranella sp.]
MKYVAIAAVLLCGLTAGCAVRSERTVVERPAAPSTAAVVVTPDPPPPTTVYVPD